MKGERFIAARSDDCLHCGFCRHYIDCARSRSGCIGCGACVIGCPQGARHLKAHSAAEPEIGFSLDGEQCLVKGPISVFDALCELGRAVKEHRAGDGDLQALCGTGGCWSCSVLIDGVLTRACMTPLREGMEIVTDPKVLQSAESRRIVTLMRPAPHYHPSIFTHGCNYRCHLCHNWEMTFSSAGTAMTPMETVKKMRLNPDEDYWIGISGGEPTLNRNWLLATLRALRQAVPESRIQLDTNASLLTFDYIDKLVEAGITDISPDLKARNPDTFMKVVGIRSTKIARRYLDTSWQAVRYLNDTYGGQVFMAVSIPCHPRTHSRAELDETARAIAAINPEIAVTLIEYQPAFRSRDWPFLSGKVMDQAREIVEAAGLQKVIVQGGQGIPRAVDPMELALSSENF